MKEIDDESADSEVCECLSELNVPDGVVGEVARRLGRKPEEVFKETFTRGDLTIEVKTYKVHFDSRLTLGVYHVEVFDRKASWCETFQTRGEINAFLRGFSASASFFGGVVLSLPWFDLHDQ